MGYNVLALLWTTARVQMLLDKLRATRPDSFSTAGARRRCGVSRRQEKVRYDSWWQHIERMLEMGSRIQGGYPSETQCPLTAARSGVHAQPEASIQNANIERGSSPSGRGSGDNEGTCRNCNSRVPIISPARGIAASTQNAM
jgi:hypothetical protein